MSGQIHENRRPPSKEEMDAVFTLCRNNHWTSCLQCLQRNPIIGETIMIMDNHIATTVIHQAITSKGDIRQRANVILQVLAKTPAAASIKNGYGSLPLHVISQRNTKIDAKTKERLLMSLIRAYPGALTCQGGVSRRTPLHIIFTDYISSHITGIMIEQGKHATFMRDKSGYLPIHIAASRHVSPFKLQLLLEANPESITARTDDGMTVLSLAQATATASHPNYRLIETLRGALQQAGCRGGAALDAASIVPARVSSGDASDSSKSNEEPKTTKKRKPKNSSSGKRASKRIKIKQEVMDENPANGSEDDPAAAGLLLHFSRKSNTSPENKPDLQESYPTQFAEV